jgi:hypothetical protein
VREVLLDTDLFERERWSKTSQDCRLEARLLNLYAALLEYENLDDLSYITDEECRQFRNLLREMANSMAMDRVAEWYVGFAEGNVVGKDYSDARYFAETVIELLNLKETPHVGRAHQVLGLIGFEEGDWTNGIEHLEKAESIFEKYHFFSSLNDIVMYLTCKMDACKENLQAFDRLQQMRIRLIQKNE